MLNRLFPVVIALSFAFATTSSADQSRRGSVAFGLGGISDWSTQHPFLDAMLTARPWFGHLPGQWGGVSHQDLIDRGVLDPNGMPLEVPSDLDALEVLVLTDQPEDASHLAGRYVLTFEGDADLSVVGRVRVVLKEARKRVFIYQPGPDFVGIRVTRINPEDPLRNMRIVKEDDLADWQDGQRLNPEWAQKIKGAALLRFMDWGATNDSPILDIEDFPQTSDFSYAWRGVPIEVMIDVANQTDADPWFTIPHGADDALVRHLAETVEAQLAPHLVAHVEYSNEVWNFIFSQSQWAQENAEALWGEVGDGWVQYYGLRAAQVMDIWTDVFGTTAEDRLKRILGVQTGWPGLEQSMLSGALATQELGREPYTSFDAYAVTGYFGHDLSAYEPIKTLLDDAEDSARQAGEAQGLSRVALREYVNRHRFDTAIPKAAEIVRNGSVRELSAEVWPYHADVARKHGLELMMYEGGTHATPFWDEVENERLVDFLIAFNYSEEMGALYEEVIEAWATISDAPFNAFVDVTYPSKWGSWGALRHLDDDNPRWRALQSAMSKALE